MVHNRPRRADRSAARLIFVTLVVTALAACGSSGDDKTGTASTDGSYVIGWSLPQGTEPIFQSFTEALTAAGGRTDVDVMTLDARLAYPASLATERCPRRALQLSLLRRHVDRVADKLATGPEDDMTRDRVESEEPDEELDDQETFETG